MNRLNNAPSPLKLEDLLDLLGHEQEWWESILRALLRADLKLALRVCRGDIHPLNLDKGRTLVETDVVRAWLKPLPKFPGQFQGAPPIMTEAAILARIGKIRKPAFEKEHLPKAHVWFGGNQITPDVYETADVVAWWDRVKPELPASSPAVATTPEVSATVVVPDLKDLIPKPKSPPAPYVTVRIELPIQKSADGLVETTPTHTPATVTESGPTATPIAMLLALLDEVDKRAAEQGAGFNRNALPGTKQEFHRLAIAFNRRAFSKALPTFSDYLKGRCQFQSGVSPEHGKGAAVWALFPEYSLKLG